MITQEMVEVATIAGLTFISDGNEEQARKELLEVGNQAKEMFQAAIKAVYPLIRQQALEQAAAVCDGWLNSSDRTISARYAVTQLSETIRNLKDKTDEAHNG